MLKTIAIAAALAAAVPAVAQTVEIDEVFSSATTVEYTAQVAGTYPARNEVLVKNANGNQFALPVAAGTDLSVWRTNEVLNVVITQGAVTEISPSSVATPEASFSVLTEDVPGAPEDSVVRSVTASVPAASITVTETTVTFIGPDGMERTAPIAAGVTVEEISGEFVTVTYYDAVDISRQ